MCAGGLARGFTAPHVYRSLVRNLVYGFGGRAAILLYLKLFDTARKVDARFPSAPSDDRIDLAEGEWERLQVTNTESDRVPDAS